MDPKIRPDDDGNFTEDAIEEFTADDWREQVGGESETNDDSDEVFSSVEETPPPDGPPFFNPEHEHGDKSDFQNG
jgi:hypothetical protein